MATSKGLVLVTGANGYIAAVTVEAFLKAGYSVRGTVRSVNSAKGLVDALSQYGSRLEFVEVPDITAPGAFDSAVAGVTAIAHLASPVSLSFTDPEPVIRTAVGATVGVLESALRVSPKTVKSVVVMSSVAAVAGSDDGSQHRFTEADWNDGVEDLVARLGKESPGPAIYAASKNAAEHAFWRFRHEHKPAFTMTAINPVFVAGPPTLLPEDPEKLSATTKFIWQVSSGQEIPPPITPGATFVDVRDVARLVVFGVEHPEKANGERFLAASARANPQAAADILRKHLPADRRDTIKEGNPGEGYEPGYPSPSTRVIDASKAVRVTGQDWIPFEKTVLDSAKVFERYL